MHMKKRTVEEYYVFRARCIINADNYGELKFLTQDELYRRFSKENPAFLFEFSGENFDLTTFTENLKYPLYATQHFTFPQVFFVLHMLPDEKNMKIIFFDRGIGNWNITDIDDEHFLNWNDFAGDEFDEIYERFSLFIDDLSAKIHTQKALEKEHLANGL